MTLSPVVVPGRIAPGHSTGPLGFHGMVQLTAMMTKVAPVVVVQVDPFHSA
jgi:hypothetical protein